ncbi:MAG TPA: hypothetical protein VFX28_06890, partial [Methylomirabilota bacterium]|nr:hypothetical protein [Methylomirabilota bacterium]
MPVRDDDEDRRPLRAASSTRGAGGSRAVSGRRAPRTDAWSIDDGYTDALGAWRTTSEESRRAVVRAMGGDPEAPGPETAPAARVVREGEA